MKIRELHKILMQFHSKPEDNLEEIRLAMLDWEGDGAEMYMSPVRAYSANMRIAGTDQMYLCFCSYGRKPDEEENNALSIGALKRILNAAPDKDQPIGIALLTTDDQYVVSDVKRIMDYKGGLYLTDVPAGGGGGGGGLPLKTGT